MSPYQLKPPQVMTCPTCGFAAQGWHFTSGWMVRTPLGTYLGNEENPPHGHVEPFPSMNKTVLVPCGHQLWEDAPPPLEPDPEADHRAYPAEMPTRFPADFETECGTCSRKIRLVSVSNDGVKFTHYARGSL